MRIYLAGSVPKGDREARSFRDWRQDYVDALRLLNPLVETLDPNVAIDENNPLLVCGMDCFLIRGSDVVIVNAESRLGVGTSQEMLVAKYFGKPVVTVLPKNSAHRKSDTVFHGELVADWIHPFIYLSSDVIVESLDAITLEHLNIPHPKTLKTIDRAIGYYMEKSDIG